MMYARWVLWMLITGLLFACGCSGGGIVSPAERTEDPGGGSSGVWVNRTTEPTSWTDLKEKYRRASDARPPKDNG